MILASVLYGVIKVQLLVFFFFWIYVNDLNQAIKFVKLIILLITQTYFISVNLKQNLINT